VHRPAGLGLALEDDDFQPALGRAARRREARKSGAGDGEIEAFGHAAPGQPRFWRGAFTVSMMTPPTMM
jgi:hypothetical protein